MKNPYLILFALFALAPVQALSALSEGDRSSLQPRNYLTNGGAEFGLAKISGNPSPTVASSPNVLEGNRSFLWDSASAGQVLTLESLAVTSGKGLSGADTVLSCGFKAASGAATHTLCLYDGSAESCQTIISDTTKFVRASVFHPAPTSGTLTPRIKSVASNEPGLYIDGCSVSRLDEARTAVGPVVTEWAGYTPVFTGFGTVTGDNCRWRRVADTVEVSCEFDSGTTTATEARVSLPMSLTVSTAHVPTVRIVGVSTVGGATATFSNVLALGGESYFKFGRQDGSNSALTAQNGSAMFSSTAAISFHASVPVSGWSSSGSALTLDQFGTAWSGYQANTTGWAVGNTAFTNCSAGSPTLTEQINKNFGTVSNAASSDCGITITPKKSAVYLVMAEVGVLASTAMYGSLQMVDGSNNVLDPGRAHHIPNNNFSSMSSSTLINGTANTAFTLRFRLAASTGTFQIFGPVITGQAAIKWTILDLTSFGAATLRNVPTSGVDYPTIRWAYVTASVTACAISAQDGSWLSSCSQSATGTYDFVVNGGVFSSTPFCSVTKAVNNGVDRVGWYSRNSGSSSTLVRLLTGSGSGGMSTLNNDTNGEYILMCAGAR